MSDFFPQLKRREQYSGMPGVSGYRRFRVEVCNDCLRRCVYCDSHDAEIGGDPMMELDHFRPRSHFETLKNDPTNLVYACRSCNSKKRDDWPAGNAAATYLNGEGYIDPFAEDRYTFFRVSETGEVEDLQPPAAYIIRRLGLNRPLLRNLRKRRMLLRELRLRIDAMVPRLQVEIERAAPDLKPLLQELLIILRVQEAINALL